LPFCYYDKKKREKQEKKEHKSLKAKRAENIRRKIKIKAKNASRMLNLHTHLKNGKLYKNHHLQNTREAIKQNYYFYYYRYTTHIEGEIFFTLHFFFFFFIDLSLLVVY